MNGEKCKACGGELFVFQSDVRGVHGDMPTACRKCGRLEIKGEVVNFPVGMAEKVATLAEEATRHGKDTRCALEGNPQARIESYFGNVYKAGYFDGWVKATAYFHTHLKEGRIKRLRELWTRTTEGKDKKEKFDCDNGDDSAMIFQMSIKDYREFDLLLKMGAKESDAQGTENPGSAG